MHQMYTIVFAVSALFALAIADSTADSKKHNIFQHNSTKEINITLFTFDVKSVKVKVSDANDSKVFDKFDLSKNGKLEEDHPNVNQTWQEFTLTLSPSEEISLTFVKSPNETKYSLGQVEYTNVNASNVYATQALFETFNPDLKVTNNKFKYQKQGYKCGSLKMTLQGDQKNATIEFTDISFVAFQNSTHKSAYLECRQEPGSSVVPLAVGGTLLVFMGVALIVYIFMRNRSG